LCDATPEDRYTLEAPMRNILLLLLGIQALAVLCSAGGPDQKSYPSTAPIVNGYNDPNAIHYDAVRESRLERMEQEWEPDDFEQKQGFLISVDDKSGGRRVDTFVHYTTEELPLGDRFLAEDLVRFLDRRANGDLREGRVKSKFMPHDVCAVIQICREAQVKSATAAMLKLLNDPNIDVQSEAYRWIACVGADDPAVFDALAKTMGEGRMNREIAENMFRFGPRGLPVILKALEKNPDSVVVDSILYFERVDWKPAIGVLTKLLEDKDQEVQRSAACALGHLGPQAESAIPALIKLHAAGRTYSAYFGYWALAKMSAKARDAMLADARLPGGDYARAIETLTADWPDGKTSPIVIDALHHPEAKIRVAAVRTLWGPGASAAVPALINCLIDPDTDVQCAAAAKLGGIGRAAAAALPALRAAVARDPGGPHGDLYFAAGRAIKEIERSLEH